jgi:hypothetical protein
MAPSKPSFEIKSGTCSVLYAFDVAQAVDLDAAARLIRERTERERMRHQRRAPRYFEYRPPPLRLSQPIESIELAPGFRTQPSIDLIIYEFGAVAVTFSIDLRGGHEGLAVLSDRLTENEPLLLEATHRVSALIDAIRGAAVNPGLAPIVEDYIIYHIRELAGESPPREMTQAWRQEIAGILRSERQELSEQEVDDALDACLSYTPRDLTLIDWQAAIIIDPSADDVRAVLEFINVELLELRYLDDQLDRVLDRAYKALTIRTWRDWLLLHAGHREMRKLARLQIDAAVVFEEVNNALKLFGDQFLARVHRMASKRFHISDWDEAVIRKLDTIDSIFQKISDRQSTRRMEILEWIIIILIAVSILVMFLPGK